MSLIESVKVIFDDFKVCTDSKNQVWYMGNIQVGRQKEEVIRYVGKLK